MKQRGIIWGLPILACVLNMVSIFFLPDKIPIHFNIYGKVDSWGNRYYMFLFVFFILFLSSFYELLIQKINKDIKNIYEDELRVKKKNLIKNLYYLGFFTELVLLCMNVIIIIFSYKLGSAFKKEKNIDIVKITIIFISVYLIILGNYLPKCKRNSILGIRTRWSLECDKNWLEMQRMSGVLFILTGLVSIVTACFVGGDKLIVILFIILSMLILAIFFYPAVSKHKNKK